MSTCISRLQHTKKVWGCYDLSPVHVTTCTSLSQAPSQPHVPQEVWCVTLSLGNTHLQLHTVSKCCCTSPFFILSRLSKRWIQLLGLIGHTNRFSHFLLSKKKKSTTHDRFVVSFTVSYVHYHFSLSHIMAECVQPLLFYSNYYKYCYD